MLDATLLLAQSAAPQGPGAPFGSPILFMAVIFGVMWMFIILPNQRRDKKRREMLDNLSKGDTVVTHGGVCGKIVGLSDTNMVLKVSDDPPVKIEFVRGAVSQVNPEESDTQSKN